ncbi:MAG: hypothetical protein JJU28_12075 [Cyclobacteriaceae bacterium]|nr:hypothetical protein [Cyclobacteriaceae bacterium]
MAGYAHGKVSLGIDAGFRFEKAHFHDPKGYIFKRLIPNGTIGLTVNYAHTVTWELGTRQKKSCYNLTYR